jgi:hypothetical protein
LGADASQLFVDLRQPPNQILDLLPGIGPARGSTKMGAASKGTIGVYLAFARAFAQQGTTSVGFVRKPVNALLPQRLRGEQSFTAGKIGCLAGETKLTALRTPQTRPLHGTFFQISIHGLNGRHSLRRRQ